MAKKNSLELVPYGVRGNWNPAIGEYENYRSLLEYVGGWEKGVEWRDNKPFIATLKINNLERGRSAARFWFVDQDTGTHYPFFGQGLVDMLSKVSLRHGVVTGKWIAVKRGANYGIELYEDEE